MRNLAGDERCERSIYDELGAVGVPVIEDAKRAGDPDIKSRLMGQLGPFRFRRAWYYWVVVGPVPLAIAKELYDDPVGKKDVRVDGHCGCPAPESPWVTYVSASGKKLITPESAGHPRHENPSDIWADIYAKIDAECEIVEDPAAVAAEAYVDCYHIDSAAGLRLFVDTIRRAGLVDEPKKETA